MISAAIPTMYGGTQFRSRIEARWAAFFDILQWRWEYEPIDCSGWIPDFLLPGEFPTLVEVKSISKLSELRGKEVKCEHAAEDYSVIIVGCGLDMENKSEHWCSFGWSCVIRECEGVKWVSATIASTESSGKWDWCDATSHRGRLTGERGLKMNLEYKDHLTQCWREAGNRVQYKPPKAEPKPKTRTKRKTKKFRVVTPEEQTAV